MYVIEISEVGKHDGELIAVENLPKVYGKLLAAPVLGINNKLTIAQKRIAYKFSHTRLIQDQKVHVYRRFE